MKRDWLITVPHSERFRMPSNHECLARIAWESNLEPVGADPDSLASRSAWLSFRDHPDQATELVSFGYKNSKENFALLRCDVKHMLHIWRSVLEMTSG